MVPSPSLSLSTSLSAAGLEGHDEPLDSDPRPRITMAERRAAPGSPEMAVPPPPEAPPPPASTLPPPPGGSSLPDPGPEAPLEPEAPLPLPALGRGTTWMVCACHRC
uniref:Uncharacterized protein n=1 Tax=Pseudictyota dubia TaxID=2749911 RepID=A0A7R9VTV5_9STRA